MNLQRPPYNGNSAFPNQVHGHAQSMNPNAFNNHGGYNNNINQRMPEYSGPVNASLQQRLHDQPQRSQSPSLHNPAYNVNPVVPAKRPRGGDDDSNRQTLRPQTPAYAGSAVPNPYQHLQHGMSNGATPSPRTAQQTFLPGHLPTSNAQSPNTTMSPASAQGMQNGAMGMNRGPNSQMNFSGMPGNAPQPPNSQPPLNNDIRGHSMYEKQAQLMNASRPNIMNRGNMGPMPNMGTSNINNVGPNEANRPTLQGQNPAIQQKQKMVEARFMNSLTNYMVARGQTLEPDPRVCGRPVSYQTMFSAVNKYRTLINGHPGTNNWSLIAASLGLPPQQLPVAAEETRNLFQRNLFGFTKDWMTNMTKRQAQAQQQQQGMQQQGGQAASTMNRPGPQFSPQAMAQPVGRPQQPQASPTQGYQQNQQSEPGENGQPTSTMTHQSPPQRGGSMPQFDHQSPPNSADIKRRTSNDVPFGTVDNLQQPSPRPSPPTASLNDQLLKSPDVRLEDKLDHPAKTSPRALVAETPSNEYHPTMRLFTDQEDPYHGGVPVDKVASAAEALVRERPCIPKPEEMGQIDLEALSLSIQSGIHGEVRYALDSLTSISYDTKLQIDLIYCEGLLEALYDCAEDQLELLSRHCQKVQDHVDFPQFERLAREVVKENRELHQSPAFATHDYQLEHAADRLIAITTILRNFSIPDSKNNHDMLTNEEASTFFASMIRRIGMRPNLLRTHRNLLDFMKDIVTLLSNISHRLHILSKEDASAVLHFLLAFAPEASPTVSDKDQLSFQAYDPRVHQYLPSAVDSLAKLLSQYDPNRPLFKSVFSEDRPSIPEARLLTRAFALAIAPIPDRQSSNFIPDRAVLVKLTQERNPFFSQAMLLGDILANTIQGLDEGLARQWLASADGWASSLLHLLVMLGFERDPSHTRTHAERHHPDLVMGGCGVIAYRGLGMLKSLSDKVSKMDDDGASYVGIQPDRRMMMSAALTPHFDRDTLRLLLGFGGLEG